MHRHSGGKMWLNRQTHTTPSCLPMSWKVLTLNCMTTCTCTWACELKISLPSLPLSPLSLSLSLSLSLLSFPLPLSLSPPSLALPPSPLSPVGWKVLTSNRQSNTLDLFVLSTLTLSNPISWRLVPVNPRSLSGIWTTRTLPCHLATRYTLLKTSVALPGIDKLVTKFSNVSIFSLLHMNPQDCLKWGHLNKQDTFCFPE